MLDAPAGAHHQSRHRRERDASRSSGHDPRRPAQVATPSSPSPPTAIPCRCWRTTSSRAFAEVEFSLDYPTKAKSRTRSAATAIGTSSTSRRGAAMRLGVGVTIIAVIMKHQLRPPGGDRRRGQGARRAAAAQRLPGGTHRHVRHDLRGILDRLRAPVRRRPTSSPSASRWCARWPGWRRVPAAAASAPSASRRAAPCSPASTGPAAARRCGCCSTRAPPSSRPSRSCRRVRCPQACLACAYLATCGGGCAGRRRLMDQLDQPDPYCPDHAGWRAAARGAVRGGPRDGQARERLHHHRGRALSGTDDRPERRPGPAASR